MKEKQLTKNIELQIRNNFFRTKEDLYRYLLQLKKQQNNLLITEKDIEKLLKLYDELHIKSEFPLDMNHYSNKNINNKNFIVSETNDRILTTTGNSSDFIKEFKDTQNEILAYTQNGNINSNEVFNKIASTKKEELTLLPLHEAIGTNTIDEDILYKIKFFITRAQINPYAFKVDIKNGIFYNQETNQMYEVRKNESTNKYAIYVSGEIKYDNTTNIENESETIQNDRNEEQILEETKDKPKTRKLTKNQRLNNAAFTNIGFLLINIISFIIISISIGVILLNN